MLGWSVPATALARRRTPRIMRSWPYEAADSVRVRPSFPWRDSLVRRREVDLQRSERSADGGDPAGTRRSQAGDSGLPARAGFSRSVSRTKGGIVRSASFARPAKTLV